MLKEYKEFAFRGNLLDLAVAFIMGVAFSAVVSALANDVIMGTIAQVLGFDDLEVMSIGRVLIGTFIAAVIYFLIVATVLFFLIRAATRFQRADTEETPDTDEVILLREIRDALHASGRTGPARDTATATP